MLPSYSGLSPSRKRGKDKYIEILFQAKTHMLRKFYKQLKARLGRKYRVEFIDDVTLSRSREFILKPITVIALGMLLLVGTVGGTAALALYTPAIHRHIPNYIDPAEFDAKMEQTNQILLRME